MTSVASTSIWYVYGVVPADFARTSLPQGLDDRATTIEREGALGALVTELSGAEYAPLSIETRSGDVEWLGPRAVAHDRVLTWASEHGAVIPLPMFSLFSGANAVRDMLRARAGDLGAALTRVGQGREYALRVYRVDAELLASVVGLSDSLQELAERAAAASPGQRYLLERKLDGEKRAEMRTVTQRVVNELVEALAPASIDTVRDPIPKASEAADLSRGQMVLNVSFLVTSARLDGFQRILTGFVERYTPAGFRFDFTGPWPPYHFVNERHGN